MLFIFFCRFRSFQGLFEGDTQRQVEEIWDPTMFYKKTRKTIETVAINRTELVPAAFYCENGCGGNQTTPEDITIYENGVCITMNKCE